MKRFYALPENFIGNEVSLNTDETKHLRDVLRLRIDENVLVFDGLGNEFSCAIERIDKNKTTLRILEKSKSSATSFLDLTLAIALLKGEKFDLVVQKASELGVLKVIPLTTKRADVKIRDARDAQKKVDRWRRISLEAAKQCGRATLLEVDFPIEFTKFIESRKTVQNRSFLLFSERGGEKFSSIENTSKITAIIGSEGGWEDIELELARCAGVQVITLGGRILRAETAGIAVSALLQNHFGDLN